MRVTQRMLYGQYIGNMNTSLTTLMDLNNQAQTQKKINRPSDDPDAMVRILGHRDAINRMDQYKENIDTSKGWLTQADSALTQTSELLTKAKTLAEQASSGTYTADQREQIAYQLRSIYDQLVGLANTSYEDKSIFAGQKVDGNAYEKITWMTSNDEHLNNTTNFTISGNANKTVLVQYRDSTGAVAPGGNIDLNDPNLVADYSYDGGKSFQTATRSINADGSIHFDFAGSGTAITFSNNTQVKTNADGDYQSADGTWMWLRPSAQYVGDDAGELKVQPLGQNAGLFTGDASGSFSEDVVVRIDKDAANLNDTIEYSFSNDGGLTWITGNKAKPDGDPTKAVLSIPPGGTLTLNNGGGDPLNTGSQFVVHPRSAYIEVQINSAETVQVNDVGFDFFGGVFQDPDAVVAGKGDRVPLSSSNSSVGFDDATELYGSDEVSKNMFETLGNLIGYLETNNQQGCQESLEDLKATHAHVLNFAANIGGRKNRVDIADTVLQEFKDNEKARLSHLEDADVTELMTDLSQEQLVYEMVLRSSSMIMQMNLSKFL
ncbi:MAG: flagellar hook-associated protein FlgL [Desulfovibrio sp.]